MENTEYINEGYPLKKIVDSIVDIYYELLVRQFSLEIILLSRKEVIDKGIERSIKESEKVRKKLFTEALQSIGVPGSIKNEFTEFMSDIESKCASMAEEKFKKDIYKIYTKI